MWERVCLGLFHLRRDNGLVGAGIERRWESYIYNIVFLSHM
jgi:hypothetical protein